MGFIFGLLIGSALTGTPGTMQHAIGSIPMRCLAAIEVSDDEYRDCREPSLKQELHEGSPCRWDDIKGTGPCSFDRNIKWEIAALRELKSSIEANKAVK